MHTSCAVEAFSFLGQKGQKKRWSIRDHANISEQEETNQETSNEEVTVLVGSQQIHLILLALQSPRNDPR
jgi:hypothetical protein